MLSAGCFSSINIILVQSSFSTDSNTIYFTSHPTNVWSLPIETINSHVTQVAQFTSIITISNTNDKSVLTNLNSELFPSADGFSLLISSSKSIPSGDYIVKVATTDLPLLKYNGKDYAVTIQGDDSTVIVPSSPSAIIATILSTSSIVSTDTPMGLGIMGGLLALDPTGTFFRFTKILQILNKLYFININYGKRLELFLYSLARFTPDTSSSTRPHWVYNIKHTRGKLSLRRLSLDLIGSKLLIVCLYIVSWLIKGLKRLVARQQIMGKIGIYFCHYANKVHLIIFNLVFIDFIWLAPRTLLHSRDLPVLNYYGS